MHFINRSSCSRRHLALYCCQKPANWETAAPTTNESECQGLAVNPATQTKYFAVGLKASWYGTKFVVLSFIFIQSATVCRALHIRCLTFSFILSVVPPCHTTIFERVSNTTPDVSAENTQKRRPWDSFANCPWRSFANQSGRQTDFLESGAC